MGERRWGSMCGKALPGAGGAAGSLRAGAQCSAAGARGQRRAGGRCGRARPGLMSCVSRPGTAPCCLMARDRELLLPVSRCPDRDEGSRRLSNQSSRQGSPAQPVLRG